MLFLNAFIPTFIVVNSWLFFTLSGIFTTYFRFFKNFSFFFKTFPLALRNPHHPHYATYRRPRCGIVFSNASQMEKSRTKACTTNTHRHPHLIPPLFYRSFLCLLTVLLPLVVLQFSAKPLNAFLFLQPYFLWVASPF